MTRTTMYIAVLLASVTLTTPVAAKTSISSLAQPEPPCPGALADSGGGAAGLAVTPVVLPTIPAKPNTRAARSRWKALLPGSIKSSG